MLEELCKRIQHCCATLQWSQNKRNVGSCWLKSLTGFKLCATTCNKCNRVCKRTQHVTSNNLLHVSCWPTMLRPFARGFRVQRFSFNNWDWCSTTVRILRSFYFFKFFCWKETINFSVWQYRDEKDKHLLKSKARPWKRTQQCWLTTPNIVGCYMLCPFTGICCSKFETGSNIVGPTMLGVVPSVCT